LLPHFCHHPKLATLSRRRRRRRRRRHQLRRLSSKNKINHFFHLASFSTTKSHITPVVLVTVTARAAATKATEMVKSIRVHELGGPEVSFSISCTIGC